MKIEIWINLKLLIPDSDINIYDIIWYSIIRVYMYIWCILWLTLNPWMSMDRMGWWFKNGWNLEGSSCWSWLELK